ncbi:MAG: leucine-rich repeat protein [Oscillospiraceae bacterium]|nr:leucine-rich repeat protein [Oscillospiraceae bacterium]
MKRRVLLYILTLVILASLAVPAAAAEQGSCGDGLSWTYENGKLTITGEGEMDDYGLGAPWDAYREEIEELVLEGVTYIGACAFRDYDALKTVDFGDDLYQIGQYAFDSCDGLTSISLPETFKIFDEGSFQSCKNLTEIHCAGKFPTFRHNSMWETSVTIYYPAERPWSLELIAQLETAFRGRIEFRGSDGSDLYEYTGYVEETQPPETELETQPETQPETLPPTEVPETEAPTVPPVPETEPPVTEAPTEPETAPTEETPAPTEPVEPEETAGVTGLLIGLLIVIIVMTLVIIGALIFKSRSHGGRFSS